MASLGNTSSTTSSSSGGSEPSAKVYEKKSELEAVIRSPKGFKRLMKRTVCGECGVKGFMTSRFGNVSALVLPSMINMFWCESCGRLLCEKHRGLHTCERVDALAAKRRAMTAEEVRQEVEEAAQLKLQREVEAAAAKAESDARKASEYFEIKEKRHTLSAKAGHIASFIQSQAVRAPNGSAAKQELLDMQPVALRIRFELHNETESPTVNFALREDIWAEIKAMYLRAVQITGMVMTLDGGPLDVRNSWEPLPPAPEQQQPQQQQPGNGGHGGGGGGGFGSFGGFDGSGGGGR